MALTDGIPASLLLHGMARASDERALAEGIKAFVRMYYQNYSDARRLDAYAVSAIEGMLMGAESSDDIEELVTEAETEINETGGVRSANDGTIHMVQTFEPDDD